MRDWPKILSLVSGHHTIRPLHCTFIFLVFTFLFLACGCLRDRKIQLFLRKKIIAQGGTAKVKFKLTCGVYFDQRLGAAHSKHWSKSQFSKFLCLNAEKLQKRRNLLQNSAKKQFIKVCTKTLAERFIPKKTGFFSLFTFISF